MEKERKIIAHTTKVLCHGIDLIVTFDYNFGENK